jgi:cysteine synthase
MLAKLRAIVDEAASSAASRGTRAIHAQLVADDRVRELLEIDVPRIDDVSATLGVSRGQVLAVRMDEAYGDTGFKKPVMASLILKRLIESAGRRDVSNKWIDGGNVNSCLALAYYARRFEGKAAYVMSRHFPDYVLEYIKEVTRNSISLIASPDLGLGIERDFYRHLVDLVRTDREYKRYQPLWHAKYGGAYTQFLGKELADQMDVCPDYVVSVVGAGATLEGQAIPVKRRFANRPRIVVPEHAESLLLFARVGWKRQLTGRMRSQVPEGWFSQPPAGIPHYVIGPHYEELNPLISADVLACVDEVIGYTDDEWMSTSLECHGRGLRVGNSSAANLAVARRLADEGHVVLTFVYEPFRSFYQGRNTACGWSEQQHDGEALRSGYMRTG